MTGGDDASRVSQLRALLDGSALCSLKSNMWKSDLPFPADKHQLIHPKTTARLRLVSAAAGPQRSSRLRVRINRAANRALKLRGTERLGRQSVRDIFTLFAVVMP